MGKLRIMDKKTERVVFPQLGNWVVEMANQSERLSIRNSADMIKQGLSLLEVIPDEHSWHFISDVTMENILSNSRQTKSSAHELNRVYWGDVISNWQAYSLTTYWRGVELIQPAIRTLNLKELIAAAVLARALLELSANFLNNSRVLKKFIEDIPDLKTNNVASQKFEYFINKALWGTKSIDKHNPLFQVSAVDAIRTLSDFPQAEELLPTYKYLCEVAHPNFAGNARFWSHIEDINEDGSENRVISRFSNTESAKELIENTLWALAWGSVAMENSFKMSFSALDVLVKKLD